MNLVKRIKMGAERFNFDFDTSGLSAYADENSDELFRRAVTAGRTLSLIRIQDGVKGSAKIKLLNDSVTYQLADDCSMTADGNSTIFTDRTLTTVKMGFYKTFCQDDLSGFWTRLALRAGAMAENEELIFEQEIMDYILEIHSFELEKMIWQGDSALVGGNLQFIDGLATRMDADAGVPDANATAIAAVTSSNAYAVFLSVARAIPSTIYDKADTKIFCGREYFNFLKDDLFSQNLYHVPVASQEDNQMILPATGFTVEMVQGLSGQDGIYAGRSQDMIFGTDLASDAGSVEMWYDKDDDVIKIRSKFYGGTQYPFSDQLVKWNPA